MTFRPSPSVDDLPPAEAWRELEIVLDEIAGLAESDLPANEFHGRVLERLASLLSAAGGMIWRFQGHDRPELDCQLNLGEALGGDRQELERHEQLATATRDAGEPRQVPPAYRDGQLANASPWCVLLCPVAVKGVVELVIELLLRPDGRAAALEGYLRIIRTAGELVEQHHRRQAAKTSQERATELRSLLDFQTRIHEHLELNQTAAAIANESRRTLACDRVTVLANRGGKPRVIAISGVDDFDRRSGVVKQLEGLAAAIAGTTEPLSFPDGEDQLPTQLAEQLQAFVEESNARGLLLIPLPSAEASKSGAPSSGWLSVEKFGGVLSERERQRARQLASIAAPALENALRYESIPFRKMLEGFAAAVGFGGKRRFLIALGVTLAAFAIVAALCLIPADLTIEGRGQLMPERRQHLFAPSDGTVVELASAAGEPVTAGQVCVRLHSPQLDIALSELIGKQRTVQEELQAAETEALRGDAESNSRQSRHQLTARAQQLKEELRGLEAQLAVVREQLASLEIKSPLAGVMITWDAERQLPSRPVKKGDLLLTVADVSGPWELMLEVADREAGHVLEAHERQAKLEVAYQIGTDPGAVRQATIKFISPASELSARSEPIVRMSAVLNGEPPAGLRPGASVVARIHCGRRSLGYVWLHEIWEAVRLRLFL